MGFQASKKVVRKKLQEAVNSLAQEMKDWQSSTVTRKILDNPIYMRSTRIGIYLSTHEEVDTDVLVRDILTSGKLCFVPRCTKHTMYMEQLRSIEDYDTLNINKWGIKEPLAEEQRESCLTSGGLDLVLVPGLGFTLKGMRLGRGKGYYDKFLADLELRQSTPLVTIGIAFREQILDELPAAKHDFRLDHVITA